MNNFTEGDWLILDQRELPGHVYDYAIVDEAGWYIANIENCSNKEDEANAILIAKAPKMHRLLERILRFQKENYGDEMSTHVGLSILAKRHRKTIKGGIIMEYEKFEGKYIPKFESEELKCGNIFTKACMNHSICSCECPGLQCGDCILDSRSHCTEYLKQHREHLQNYIDRFMESLKQEKGEETMENDFPKLKTGMAITFTDYNKLGFLVSETQIMYIHPHNSYSAIVEDWDSLGDREGIDVPYSRIKAVYASTDIRKETGEPMGIVTPLRLARMAEAISAGEDPADVEGVRLVWSRQDYKEMTVKDIEKELGYKIKIIGEEK